MACRYTYQGKAYEAHEFDDVLRAMAPMDAAKFMPTVKSIPSAPLISDTKAWASLALKRAIMMAVEEGHDKIAIITGEQAADLYDLSKRVESVLYEKVNDKDLWEIEVRGLDGETILEEDEVPASRIEELIGKELAQKIINGDGEKVTPDSARDWRRLSGLDLKVGGEGMRAFYDQIIPQVARDVLKKLGGGQLQEVEIPDSNAGREVVAAQVPGESMWGVYDRQKGQWLSSWEGETYTSDPDDAELTSEKTAKNMASAIMRDAGVMLKQPGFDTTPAMREKVASGVPLFSKSRNPQVDTPEFRRWFGDSKVVDADGKPLVMYRGSQNENAAPYSDGGLIFLTTDKNFASNYATNGAVYPLYVKSSNPFDASRGRGIELWKRFEKETNAQSWALARSDRGALPYWTIEPELRRWLEKNDVEYDSIWFAESNGSSSLAVRNPTQIKSAVGNSGAFDPANPDITQSKGRTTGDYGREYTPQQLAMFKNTGRTVEKQSLVARVKEIRKDIWKKMAQGIVDQFRPIKDLGGDAYTLARLSKGSSGAFEALLNYGKLSIVDGAYDADMSGGFIKTVGEPLGAELEDFAWWLASNRAELLSAEDRENLFTPEDIIAGKSLATGQMDRDYVMLDGTVTRDRAKAYADSMKKFNAFNKNVLDIAEQSGLIDGESRQFWENEFYVPFYRVSDQDGEFMGAKIKGGLARQRAFQELKGGSQKLNSDLLANAMQNWAHLIDASAKNRAAKATLEAAERVGIAMESDQETVRQLGKSIGGKGGTVWFMDGGQQRHFLVGDPHLLVAINSLEYAGMRGPLMDALSTTKHWLTIGVTASPAFKVRNLIRDSLQAISVSDLSYNPLANLRDGIKASDRESQTYVSALASGGLIRFGTMLENNGAERVRRLVQKGVKPETILDSDDKLRAFYGKVIEPAVAAYNELGNRGEEINRAALFDQLKRQGMGQAEAALMARDLLDFSMQGTWTSIRFLTQVVPFLNARLQGLYVLGKGAAKNPQKFAITTGAVALASIALLAAYHDDEDWKKREDWDRDSSWWFKIGGVAYRIPKPFEIGAIGTLAERGVELFVNDEFTLKRFLERVKHIASDNLAMNPVPQAIKPMMDIYANKDSFSGRPIESMGMERLQAEYRYNANTSMVARAASTALNTVTRGTVGSDSLSPLQIDSLVRGYTGWLGTTIVASADALFRPLTNEPTRPQADYLKVVTQGIARQLPESQSKYVSAIYDQAKILEQAYATHRQLVKDGKVEDAREFAAENRDQLQRYKLIERVKQMQADANKRVREIEKSSMSPEAKRDAIQKIRESQSRSAALVY